MNISQAVALFNPYVEELEHYKNIEVEGMLLQPTEPLSFIKDWFMFFRHTGHNENMVLGIKEDRDGFILLMPNMSVIEISNPDELSNALTLEAC